MIVVLDASAAVEIVLGRAPVPGMAGMVGDAESVCAPHLYVAEVTHAFWKYHRFQGLPREACEKAVGRALELPDRYWDDRDLQAEALAMACAGRRPVYNMLYLVLARRQGAVLLTADRALRDFARRHDVRVAG